MNRLIPGVAGMMVGGLAAATALVGGCASGERSGERASPPAAQAMFDQVKGLAGTWEMTDDKGQKHVGVVYQVVSNGSAVCEQMMPGTNEAMVNMYHLDGDRLLVTHYCGMGNQPRMAARTQKDPHSIVFEFESVTNVRSPHELQMSALELEIPDHDHLTQKWTSMQDGKVSDHAVFAMTRKR